LGGVVGLFQFLHPDLTVRESLRDLDGAPRPLVGQEVPDAAAAGAGVEAELAAADLGGRRRWRENQRLPYFRAEEWSASPKDLLVSGMIGEEQRLQIGPRKRSPADEDSRRVENFKEGRWFTAAVLVATPF
jgi:hypothetical protein